MNATAFRQFYEYHFSENRKIWDTLINALSQEQFTRSSNYSHGSICDQIIHLISVDEIWFCELQNILPSQDMDAAKTQDREVIRTYWDQVETMMRGYLAQLPDHILFEKPIVEPEEDKNLAVWQVLLHVANHGTDHRAQLLRQLNDLGLKTEAQDLIFYLYDHPLP
jgi:uncharacterized damage-inducible protein DinB